MKTTKHLTTLLVGIVLTGVALTGCANREAAPEVSQKPVPSGEASPAPSKEPSIIDITTQPGQGTDFVGALKDTEVTECTTGPDGAKFSGTVTNPEDSAQSYRIYVSVLAGDDTLGITEIDVNDVKPKEKTTWSGAMATTASDARCILRVERIPAG